jgi:hypothetical protein
MHEPAARLSYGSLTKRVWTGSPSATAPSQRGFGRGLPPLRLPHQKGVDGVSLRYGSLPKGVWTGMHLHAANRTFVSPVIAVSSVASVPGSARPCAPEAMRRFRPCHSGECMLENACWRIPEGGCPRAAQVLWCSDPLCFAHILDNKNGFLHP